MALNEKPEQKGSKKVINGTEVWTRRIFPPETTEDGRVLGAAIWELFNGGYIYPNGELVKDREALNFLPEQHRKTAFAWWDKTFGNGGIAEEEVRVSEASEKPSPNMLEAIMTQIKALSEQVAELKARKGQVTPFRRGMKRPRRQSGDKVSAEAGVSNG